MNRKSTFDQPVMARANGRPSPSTASHRCQARSSLIARRTVCDAFAEQRAGVRVDVEGPLRHGERRPGVRLGPDGEGRRGLVRMGLPQAGQQRLDRQALGARPRRAST